MFTLVSIWGSAHNILYFFGFYMTLLKTIIKGSQGLKECSRNTALLSSPPPPPPGHSPGPRIGSWVQREPPSITRGCSRAGPNTSRARQGRTPRQTVLHYMKDVPGSMKVIPRLKCRTKKKDALIGKCWCRLRRRPNANALLQNNIKSAANRKQCIARPEAGFLVTVHPEPCLILSRAQIRALLCSSKLKFIPA
jgi:hypothetical protein